MVVIICYSNHINRNKELYPITATKNLSVA